MIPTGQATTDARPAVADLQRLAAAVDAARAAGLTPTAAEIAQAASVSKVLAAAFIRWSSQQQIADPTHQSVVVLLRTAEFVAIPTPATAEGNQTMSTDKKTQTNLPSIRESAAAVKAAAASGDTPAPTERSPRGRRRGEIAVLLDPVQRAVDAIVQAEIKKEKVLPAVETLEQAVATFTKEIARRRAEAQRAAALLG